MVWKLVISNRDSQSGAAGISGTLFTRLVIWPMGSLCICLLLSFLSPYSIFFLFFLPCSFVLGFLLCSTQPYIPPCKLQSSLTITLELSHVSQFKFLRTEKLMGFNPFLVWSHIIRCSQDQGLTVIESKNHIVFNELCQIAGRVSVKLALLLSSAYKQIIWVRMNSVLAEMSVYIQIWWVVNDRNQGRLWIHQDKKYKKRNGYDG